MTLQFRKFPCQSSGKCRLLTMPECGEGRDGRAQNCSIFGCFPSSSRPLNAGPKYDAFPVASVMMSLPQRSHTLPCGFAKP